MLRFLCEGIFLVEGFLVDYEVYWGEEVFFGIGDEIICIFGEGIGCFFGIFGCKIDYF